MRANYTKMVKLMVHSCQQGNAGLNPFLSLFIGELHCGHPPECLSQLMVKLASCNPLFIWRQAALALKKDEGDLFHAHLSEIPSDLRELLSNWHISTKVISFSESDFFPIKHTLLWIWFIHWRFAESRLCNAFSLQISKHFIKRRVENQCFIIRKWRVVV